MDVHFIVRVLGESYELLGWAEVIATVRPHARDASCPLWPKGPTVFMMDADGRAHYIAIHWADLDIARIKAIESVPVTAGQVVTLPWEEPIWLVGGGMRDVPLPPVTAKGPVTIGVPLGTLSATPG